VSPKQSVPSKPSSALFFNEVRVEKIRLTTKRLLDVTMQVLKNPMGLSGVAILGLFTILAAFGPEIAPYDTSNLGLGKWQEPSVFATDTPASFDYITLLVPGVAGAVVSSMALIASFIRVSRWDKPNKMIQLAALAVSCLFITLITFDHLVGSVDLNKPEWLYVLSMVGISLTMLSLGTRKRVSTKRKRARYTGIVASLLPLAILSFPFVADIDAEDLPLFLFAAYVASGFCLIIAGASFVSAYKKPPAVELKLIADGKVPKTIFPTRIASLAKWFSVVLAMVVMVTGVMAYLAGNWTTHWMGTDSFGADIFSELLYGARTSMIVGIFSALIASVLGAVVGLYSGYVGGWVDEVIMRANDVVLSIPWLVLMIIVAALIGKIDLLGLILIIGLTGWSPTARMVRAQVLSIRERQYIERARAIGSSDLGIIRRHVLPNSFPLVFANTILTIAVSILSEATLSFLGMRPVGVVTWGTMLSYASQANAFAIGLHWWIIAPGLCIVFVVLGFTLLGYALDDILNPKLRKR
jgi:peptide/nickel transport system permease protein